MYLKKILPAISSGSVVPTYPWYLASGIASANCVAAYQPKGATSQAASYINLINPGTNNAAPGTAPTWDTATGWTFVTASAQYLNTGIVAADNWSVIVRFSNVTLNATLMYLCGADNGTACRFGLGYRQDVAVYDCGEQTTAAPGPNAAAVLCVAGHTRYRDGTTEAGTIPAWSGTMTSSMHIGQRNASGSKYPMTGNILALAVYNIALTGPQVAAVTTAMNAL